MKTAEIRIPPVSVQRDGAIVRISVDLQDFAQGPSVALYDKAGKFRTFAEIRADVARAAVEAAQGNVSAAGAMVGLTRQTIAKWLAE
ncbi:hypothetical protein A3C20_01190 [Candidatus Kaiserbacteria bacterium RIFCSPHIGHO2_02_FULL_55_25]|uniref:Uncharacterized protein n=1 Tax=Candidatus Kaiserbacteria bacterium RIFCSPHIGHO2_02_FULL_55_25 TaxID=1798498 RepID=A0A1F6EBL5_9BACT|nr:MAG: hypothetical protein A2764_02400 [Candidatus Kaiserbacteria bacterium RIFCSPHIGHO2_01_FULL_55_79]OGG70612.1 MAG: hypothetical protein A3C20_01190 [Candidatus Kaiserbacteria bacterium RIFCSPHIGHO2_02_FULL_55_25]OGG78726.1 MAG: hypothetical protein A3F56_00750 [Candidatus Kaiserbacteria bacterium RIFCSPHIGHO2_12_FULL_55_13]OGG82689.1 MAG: hypothetical protein A3A42_02355 [Candidatus Kaiserbacteria bacterium RIFCSPLOWO2_01_FULL_55_25]